MKISVNENQRTILRHALGITRSSSEYRNHFVCGKGHVDFDDCEDLVNKNLMVRYDPNELFGGNYCYVVTEEGKIAAKQLPKSGGEFELKNIGSES